MSDVDKLFDKIMKMPLKDLFNLCSLAIESETDEKRIETLLLIAETRIQKYRTLIRLGMKPE
jgi:hypothetical protein